MTIYLILSACRIDISDVVAIVNMILGNAEKNAAADVNNDGSVDISDVVTLVNMILNGTGTGSDDNLQAYLTCPDENHPHLIDLGLPSGTKWACCNVGAANPEDYGGYFAWGETYEKSVYNEITYQYVSGVEDDTDGYYDDWHNDVETYGIWQNLGNDIDGTDYDIAHKKWGKSWVMPSEDQFYELNNNCTSQWTTINNVDGRLFTGPSGGTIFLPAAGSHWNEDLYFVGGQGTYWSSTQNTSYRSCANGLYFNSSSVFKT